MTKDEALKLALEALKLLPPLAWTPETAKRNHEAITRCKEALAQPPLPVQEPQDPMRHYITPLMEQQMFDSWCPYKGNPDPRTVWSAAIDSANGLALAASGAIHRKQTTAPLPVQENQGLIEWKEQGEAIMAQAGVGFWLGAWWADRPWRQK